MNSSFLYHAWGLYSLECTKEEYKGNTIILHVQSKNDYLYVPNAENAIWSRMAIVSETLSVFQSVARKLLSV